MTKTGISSVVWDSGVEDNPRTGILRVLDIFSMRKVQVRPAGFYAIAADGAVYTSRDGVEWMDKNEMT